MSCMTATFMNAFYEPFAHAQKKPLVVPTPHLVECIAFSVPIRKFGGWEGIRLCIHQARLSQGCSIRDRLGPGRLVKGYDMACLQTCSLPYCRYAGRENGFKRSDRLARHVCEVLHPHNVGLLCKFNEPYTKLRMAFFF